jgi:nitronate monooxygenase
MVIAACNSGIVGTFPALNPRTETQLDEWLCQIKQSISKESTYGVNLIVHKTNKRLEGNIAELVKHKVPLVITSLGAVKDVVDEVHKYGGLVFHDVTNVVHARKAIQAGVVRFIAYFIGIEFIF